MKTDFLDITNGGYRYLINPSHISSISQYPSEDDSDRSGSYYLYIYTLSNPSSEGCIELRLCSFKESQQVMETIINAWNYFDTRKDSNHE